MRTNTLLTIFFGTGDASAPYLSEIRVLPNDKLDINLNIRATLNRAIREYESEHDDEDYSSILDNVLSGLGIEWDYFVGSPVSVDRIIEIFID